LIKNEPDVECPIKNRASEHTPRGDYRNRIAPVVADVDPKPVICDLVKLRVRDICHGRVAARAVFMQQKTRRPVQFENQEAGAGVAVGVDPKRWPAFG
jgi:hypothetical protein